MRVMVDADGYAGATDAFRDANLLAVLVGERLDRDLAGYAGMAGNDATSLEFATAYDAAASEAVAAIADLAAAFAGVGRLTSATSRNHRDAEEASVLRGGTVVLQGGTVVLRGGTVGWRLAEEQYAAHRPAAPPSSVGAQEPSFGAIDRWILDHLEGFVWPGADVPRLRATAHTWATAATSVRSLTDSCHTAADALGHLVSPEIPLALDAVDELRRLVTDTADQLGVLAGSCHEYADAVDAAHTQTRALLTEIAQMIVEGMVLSAAIGAVTGGTATAAVAGATVARVAALSPRFAAILLRLAGLAADAARAGRVAQASLVHTRASLGKFLKLELRNERGSVRVPGGLGPSRRPGWFARHATPPGHTLRDHVGATVDELADRAVTLRRGVASSFVDPQQAERLTGRVLDENADEIAAWLRGGSNDKLVLERDLGEVTGISVDAARTVTEQTGVRAVLIPSKSHHEGFQILTAFPERVAR